MANKADDFDSDFDEVMEQGAGVLWEEAIKRAEKNGEEDRRKILDDYEKEAEGLRDAMEKEWKEAVAKKKKSVGGGGEEGMEVKEHEQLEKRKGMKLKLKNSIGGSSEEGMEVQEHQQLEKPKGMKLKLKNPIGGSGEGEMAVQDRQQLEKPKGMKLKNPIGTSSEREIAVQNLWKDFEDAAIIDSAPRDQDMAVKERGEADAKEKSQVGGDGGGGENEMEVEKFQRFETPKGRSLPAWKRNKMAEDRNKSPPKEDVDQHHGRSKSVILGEMANRLRKLEKAHETWLRNLEGSQGALEYDIKVLKEKVKELELRKSVGKEEGRAFSKDELITYIMDAIGSCTTGIGCSKAYIKKFLNDRYEVPLNQYYGRRVGLLLTEGVLLKKYQFAPSHNLYKL